MAHIQGLVVGRAKTSVRFGAVFPFGPEIPRWEEETAAVLDPFGSLAQGKAEPCEVRNYEPRQVS